MGCDDYVDSDFPPYNPHMSCCFTCRGVIAQLERRIKVLEELCSRVIVDIV